MTWTPVPGSELRTTASVAVSVLPSPVFISAMLPPCRTIPPMSCTSKWRMPIVRLPTSRTTANVSGRRSSREAPLRACSRRPSIRSRSSSSLSSSSSGSKSPMRATRRSYSRNCLLSPMFSARSRRPMESSVAVVQGRFGPGEAPSEGDANALGSGSERGLRTAFEVVDRARPDGLGGAALAAAAGLLAGALDLPRELLLAEVDRVTQVAPRVVGAQRDALQDEGRLGDHVVRDRRVLLLPQLDLQAGQVRDLVGHLAEPLLHVLPKLVVDRGVAAFDVDLHGDPLVR